MTTNLRPGFLNCFLPDMLRSFPACRMRPRRLAADAAHWQPALRCLLPFLLAALLPAAEAPAWVEALRRSVQVELAPDALPLAHELPAIAVTSTYDPAAGRMQGTVHAALYNDGHEPWPDLGFVLHANNALSYVDTSIAISQARVAGRVVAHRLVEDGRGVLLPLATPLAPGAWVDCELDFTTLVPDHGGRLGLLTHDAEAHHLYSWLPEPAIRGDAWRFPAIPPMSDPSFVRACDYQWHLQIPAGWTLVAGGREERQADGGWLVLAPRTRNLVAWLSDQPVQLLALTPERGPVVRAAFVGKYTIQAAFGLSVARDAMAIASEVFGAYPRRSYDLVFTPFHDAVGGMEASGMTFLHRDGFATLDWRGRDPLLDSRDPILHATIHEVLHSWWYDQVGNDTGAEPWLDESLTEWSSWYVIERLRGREAMQRFMGARLPALALVAKDLLPLATPGADMSDTQFGILIYVRGPLLYEALRLAAGDEAFFAAAREWYRAHAGGVVSRHDWDGTFLRLLPDEERADFARSWIDGADDPVPAILDRILKAGQAEQIRSLLESVRHPPQSTAPASVAAPVPATEPAPASAPVPAPSAVPIVP